MRRGRHFATFTIRSGDDKFMGVVGPSFDPEHDNDDDHTLHRSAHGLGLYTWYGKLYLTGLSSRWEGQP